MLKKICLLLGLVISSTALCGGGGSLYPNLKTDSKSLKKWQDMKFGMFIHWGPVSLKGTEIGWSRGTQIPREEYDNLYKRFNPVKFNAEEWVRIAKTTGMKYIVITSKHHDGFCLWDSKYTDYDIMSTPFGRDVIKELSEACRKNGIMFCVYYSILDWHHPDYLPQSHGGPYNGCPPEDADFEKYVAYMKNQLAELETKYGPIGVFWFDGEWEKTWNYKRGCDLYAYCRGLRKEALVNNRVGKGRMGMQGMSKDTKFAGDFGTPEQRIGTFNIKDPWETCMTLCRQWAWKPGDRMKSLKQCVQTLVMTVSGGGNLLFNVGPMPDGRIEPRQVARLEEIGKWMAKYGETIYSTSGGPFKPGKWGGSTCRGGKIFLHVFNTKNNKLRLPSVDAAILKSSLLTGGKVKVTQSKEGIIVEFQKGSIKDIDTIVELDINRPAEKIKPAGPVVLNKKLNGYQGIWYMNQPTGDKYVYKYSGGMGTYCAKHIPNAWYAKKVNKTFFTYGGTWSGLNNRLLHMVSYYDHNTGMVPRPTLLLDKKTDDAHDNPVINIDSKGYIWIFSSSHGTSRPSYISRSCEPYSIEKFELKWKGNFSYPQPWYFKGHGFVFLHTHYTNGRSNCLMTSPDGIIWSKRRFLSRIQLGHYQVSRPWGSKKVGTAFNYHPAGKGLNWRTNLYYMESLDFGKTWRNAAGVVLKTMLAKVNNPALAYDYHSLGLKVYLKDINFDSKGRPVILYITSKGYKPGPENMPRTWTTARWNGDKWVVREGGIVSDNNYDTGCLFIEKDNLWRIIGPTQAGPQRYNPGGEVAMWTSCDKGGTWKCVRVMTKNSKYNHTYVRRPVNANPGFYALWADGNGRKPSESHLYFCNKAGDVFRLPFKMDKKYMKPELIRF